MRISPVRYQIAVRVYTYENYSHSNVDDTDALERVVITNFGREARRVKTRR